ncbi:sugar ABC transporter ATP-binding protein [Christensenella intestinihominis]|uniref:sugar ABC transporter ATP-binding protein n=1 Tax=Christensenella intestinihominis TaxID=1851429 RepID=UPI0008317593|nr:sugar ABC transporter ATP-binding protein [Christensenella intestinihominis]
MENNPDTVLELKNISKSFAANHVLKDVNFSVSAGEVRALVGENGAGKSTMIKIIAGASKPNGGTIYISGEPVHIESPRDGFHKGIAVIYQELDLLPELTVVENIFLGIEIKTKYGLLDKKQMQRQAQEYFQSMKLEIDVNARIDALPIASQQMVAISKAMMHDAKILIMDEPSSSLTNHELDVLLDHIRELKAKGITVIYISHRLEEIFGVCDSVTILRDGMMIATKKVTETSQQEIIELMTGKKVSGSRLNMRESYDAPAIMEVKGLSLPGYLENVSFTVKKGEIYGVLGLVGSGTVELGKTLYGTRENYTGDIIVNGKSQKFRSPGDALKNSISYVTDERRAQGLFMELGVEQNSIITAVKKFQKGTLNLLDGKAADTAFMEYVTRFGIKIVNREQKVQFLSGGNQQKILLTRSLLADTDIIILSSPTKGIDVGAKYEIYQILLDCARQGKTVIAISQEIPELVQICDRILMLKRGKRFKEYSGTELSEELIYNELLAQ